MKYSYINNSSLFKIAVKSAISLPQNRFLLLFTLLIFLSPNQASTQSIDAVLKISYISALRIYIDGGRNQGLEKGDTLLVNDAGLEVAKLKVVHVSSHSASCLAIEKKGRIVKGLEIVSLQKKKSNSEKVISPSPRKRLFAKEKTSSERKPPKLFSGNISLSAYSFFEDSPNGHSVYQPGLRLKFKLRELFRPQDYFEVYLRSRYYYRYGYSSMLTSNEEWRNRLYSFSYHYDNPDEKINYQIGRFSSNKISGTGYLDGGQIQYNIGSGFKTGLFAGVASTALFSTVENSPDLHKYGLSGEYEYNMENFSWYSALAAVGEYHAQIISREYLFIKNAISIQKRLNIYHSMDVEVNRDWRKNSGNGNLSVSNLFLMIDFRLFNSQRFSIKYDNRRNYYTYESRSVPDSLFDSALREGVRVSYRGRLFNNLMIKLFGGYRNSAGTDISSHSYGISVDKSNLIYHSLHGSASFNRVLNLFTKGINTNLRIYKSWENGLISGAALGEYWYTVENNNAKYSQKRVNLFINGPFFQRAFFSIDMEYMIYNKINYYRMNFQIGYSF